MSAFVGFCLGVLATIVAILVIEVLRYPDKEDWDL